MAEQGRREVVGDVLSLNVGAQPAVRDLSTMGVRNPGQTGGDAVYRDQMNTMGMLGELGNALGGVLKAKEDEYVTQGKLQFMQGATEEQIASQGNKYTMQGWQSLNVVDQANRWYASELVNIDAAAKSMNPAAYNEFIMRKRAEFMQNLPEDPAIQKLYVAAFEDLAPRLSAQQTASHNEWNKEQTGINFTGALSSGSYTNSDASTYTPGGPGIALSSGVVRSTMQYTAGDVDSLTRVILGEAAGEGAQGMAAVAHVALNRMVDGAYGKGWSDVLRPDQFNGAVAGAKYDPSSIQYQQAAAIAANVLSGHSVDPTNGRTHFVSGGIRPAWWAAEEAKGNIVKIGNHEFVGQARNLGTHSQSTATGNLIFRNEGQDDLSAPMASALSSTGRQLGIDIDIISGARSAEHNHAVGGAPNSEHVGGNASDISMAGMDDEQRANLVRTLRANGISRFITYTNSPDSLHVDTSKAQGESWFMHDRSNANMSKAPAWFQAVMNEPVQAGGQTVQANAGSDPLSTAQGLGIPMGESQSIGQTQAQDFVRNYPLPPAEKPAFVAATLVEQLGSGSTQLWDDLGGVGFLRELGATSTQINQVQNAKDAYDQKKLSEFSRERTEWATNLPLLVRDGKVLPEDAMAEIEARRKADTISDQQATSLVSAIAQEEYGLGNLNVNDPGFNRAVASIWTRLQDPNTFTAEEAQAQLELLATQYNVPRSQLENLIGTAWTREEQARNALDTSIATAAKEKATRDAKVLEVERALGNGFGLKGVTGSIDGMPAVQWGVEQRAEELRTQQQALIGQYMAEGNLDPNQAQLKASAMAENQLWRELMAQGGVVQDGLAGSMTAELSGLATSTSFVMSDGLKQTFDTYQRMLQVDPTGTYASGYFKDPLARSLMMNAQRFYSGGLQFEDAMKNAHEFVRNNITPESASDIKSVSGFNGMLGTAIRDNFGTLMGNPDWLTSSGVTEQDKAWATKNDDQLRQAVTDRAWTYFADRPQDDPSVIIKMAAQDVMRDSVIVGGNIMTPTSAGGVPVLNQMGLQGYSNDTANKAVSEYIKFMVEDERANNPNSAWVREWDKRGPDLAKRGVSMIGMPPGAAGLSGTGDEYLNDPAYYASWNQDAGTMVITLWDNVDRKFVVPAETMPPMQLELAKVGAWYKARHATQGANDFQNMWGSLFGQPAK